jgi:hypothetical protein
MSDLEMGKVAEGGRDKTLEKSEQDANQWGKDCNPDMDLQDIWKGVADIVEDIL